MTESLQLIFEQLGLSLLLGLLVGLEREHSNRGIAGLRTFPLLTLLGTITAQMATTLGVWIVAVGMLGVVAIIFIGYLHQINEKNGDVVSHAGTTTGAAMLVMFAVGAYLVYAPSLLVGIVLGGTVAVLLQFKLELHGIAHRLGDDDLRAVMRFVLISCIILPVLPKHSYGFFQWFHIGSPDLDVFNPFETWLMVVLIVGMSLAGYILYKFFGRNAGLFLGGVLGGAVSSTATTVSYAREAKEGSRGVSDAGFVIMVASTVSCLRVLVAVAAVAPQAFLFNVAPPVGVLMGLTFLPVVFLWMADRKENGPMPEPNNPTQLRSAIVFGIVYLFVLFALAYANHSIGDRGLLAVAGMSGLTEMDAVTLSTAKLAYTDANVMSEGWKMIVVAILANMLSKTVIAGCLGGRKLLNRVALLFLIPTLGGIALLLLR